MPGWNFHRKAEGEPINTMYGLIKSVQAAAYDARFRAGLLRDRAQASNGAELTQDHLAIFQDIVTQLDAAKADMENVLTGGDPDVTKREVNP